MLRSILMVMMLCAASISGFASPEKLQSALNAAMAGAPNDGVDHRGFSLHVIIGGDSYGANAGVAAPDGSPLSDDYMFRIASITKSYVGATALRLVETGAFDVSAPIQTLIDPAFNTILTQDGYDTQAITLYHVLSHMAGFFDHAQSENFITALFENPQHVWTRAEQITAAAAWGDPVGVPGEKFFYSDTGFVLLGHIIERETGMPLPVAVRTLLDFNQHGLVDTMWERGDVKAVPPARRVHQYLSGMDTHAWDPSVDLYGGGGLVASMHDVARYYSLLFGGEIYEKGDTLQTMLSDNDLPADSPYRLAVFVKTYEGIQVYEHGGFWGTLVFYDPETGTAIAGGALQQRDYPILQKMMVAFLQSLRE